MSSLISGEGKERKGKSWVLVLVRASHDAACARTRSAVTSMPKTKETRAEPAMALLRTSSPVVATDAWWDQFARSSSFGRSTCALHAGPVGGGAADQIARAVRLQDRV